MSYDDREQETVNKMLKLRAMTGCGIMNCRQALIESEGDLDKALDIVCDIEYRKIFHIQQIGRSLRGNSIKNKVVIDEPTDLYEKNILNVASKK